MNGTVTLWLPNKGGRHAPCTCYGCNEKTDNPMFIDTTGRKRDTWLYLNPLIFCPRCYVNRYGAHA